MEAEIDGVWPCLAQSVEQAENVRAEVESIPAMAHRGAWSGIDDRSTGGQQSFQGISFLEVAQFRCWKRPLAGYFLIFPV